MRHQIFNTSNIRLFMACLVPFALLAGEDDHDHHPEHGHEENGHEEHQDERLELDPSVLREFGITLGEVGPAVLHETLVLPGEIHFNRERQAHITPRFPGTVLEIRARLADKVERGDVLAVIESNETLRPFELKAPFAGTVVEYDLSPGQSVEAGSRLFTIADLTSLWADLSIYQRDLQQVQAGQEVVIEDGHDLPPYHGVIHYVAPTVDEHTRTGLARVIVENKHGQWRPGLFIRGRIKLEEHPVALAVPRSAVISLEGRTVVFVQDEDGFEPRALELGHADEENHEVLQGLAAGEIIVTRNPVSLKAELNKSSFGGHEGHAH